MTSGNNGEAARFGGRGYLREEKWFDQQIEMYHDLVDVAEMPEMPDGYLLRLYRDGDCKAYMDLFNLAFEQPEVLQRNLDTHLERGYIVVEHTTSSTLVASSIAHTPYAQKWVGSGSLGWLVTDPEHGGRGLGTAVVIAVTRRLREEGYPRAYLSTDDFRLPAISIYLNQGWKPRLHTEGMEERWRNIYTRLGREFQP
jgi:mycothiol synthase